jgi:hypothetical protein
MTKTKEKIRYARPMDEKYPLRRAKLRAMMKQSVGA